MALITCPECRKEINSKAASCPGCGFGLVNGGNSSIQTKGRNSARWIKVLSFLSIVVGIFGCFANSNFGFLIALGFVGFVIGRFME